ncbi:MAG: tRNA pseudouridine(13) synthase TruD [Planctomycetes bacterium]|nr:tRNA pseudouridine(13) synthase TruD [Planctomycetota bacterium]
MLGIPHAYLTAGLPGIGGTIKQSPEDFYVEEVPLYEPAGEGEHTYFEILKTDLSTPAALDVLARELRRDVRELGYAGLKDRKAVTRQVISISHVDPETVAALKPPQIEILWARRHRNKLRVGHLKGNRFRIRIRGVGPGAETRARSCLDVLLEKGVPNYYGPQRFGLRGDAHRIGRAFLKRDDRAAVRRILGHPSSAEQNPSIVRARELFMAGDLEQALAAFPPSYREERRLLEYLRHAGENYAGARRRLGETSRKMYFTAYQSYLFNLTLSERLRRSGGCLERLYPGDLAFLHRNGAVFRVEDADREEPRARAFEISPSGPIFGMRMPCPDGLEGEVERGILEKEGIRAADFHRLMPGLQLEGGRRPLRVSLEDLVVRQEAEDLYLELFLSKGSYATTVLREIMKNDFVPEGFYEEGEAEKHDLWRPEAGGSAARAVTGRDADLDPDDAVA